MLDCDSLNKYLVFVLRGDMSGLLILDGVAGVSVVGKICSGWYCLVIDGQCGRASMRRSIRRGWSVYRY